jgi:hypothetical protein
MASRCLGLAAFSCLASSCAIYDGGGGDGEQIRQGESVKVVERQVTLVSVEASSAKVKVDSSSKLHELPLGQYVPVDFNRGLVLNKTEPAKRTAWITGFRITRTLNPYQPF